MTSASAVDARPRIVQLHPTRRCNLRCAHCYSSSGPDARGALDEGYLRGIVDDAAAMGYRSVSVSGGEPFLYGALPGLLRHVRDAGLRTMVATNGTVFGGGRLDAVAGYVDVLAVSLDGPPDLHNRIRGDRRAFDQAVEGLGRACAVAPRAGLVYSISAGSWDWIPEAAALALDAGAAFLHLHPLEATGRAALELREALPDDRALLNGYVVSGVLRAELQGALAVHVDLVHRDHLAAAPEAFYAGAPLEDALDDPAGAIDTLVVEDDGTVVPLTYGMDRRFRLGTAADVARDGLRAQWGPFVEARLPELHRRCRTVADRLLATPAKVFNWTEAIAAPDVVSAGDGAGTHN